MKTSMTGIVRTLALAYLCMASLAHADNLLPNPGLEEGAKGWGLYIPADGEGKNCTFAVTQESPHSGSACGVMKSDDFARYTAGPSRNIPVKGGERFRFIAWIKADASTEARSGTPGFVMRAVLKSKGKDLTGSPALFVGINNQWGLHSATQELNLKTLTAPLPREWQKVEVVFEIPKDLPDLDAITAPTCFAWAAKGAFYIDDVSLEQVNADTPLSPQAGAAALSTSEAIALAALNLDAPGLEKVKQAAASGDMAAAKRAYLDYRRTGSKAQWSVMPDQQPKEAVAASDATGDDVCEHIIEHHYIFSPKRADMGKDFNWTYNPVPKDSPSYSEEFTWCAIARTHFWNSLGDAYWRTQNEKYAKEWVAQLQDFAKKNPVHGKQKPGQSTLWRTLDSAIRMTGSWPHSYYHFLNSPSFTPDAHWLYLQLMIDHADHLKAGLENTGRTGNWVSTECYALYTIGVLFPELRDAESWRTIAIDRLTFELSRVVLPDGFQAELTPSYHCGALDGFFGPYRLAKRNHMTVPPVFAQKLRDMYRVLVLTMDQSGMDVCTNDSSPVNATAMATAGLQIFPDDPQLLWASTGGKKGVAPPTSIGLPYSGFYVMRGGWDHDDTFLFFRGGPAGIAHEHEDMLQVVLRAWNKTLLLDPGIYMYDHSESRRYILNSVSHNTIIMDGKWQHRGNSKIPMTKPLDNPWVTSPLFDFVSATYDGGYQLNEYDKDRQYLPQRWVGDIDRSVTHTRRVLFLKPYYTILLDSLDGTGNHTFDAHFHMDAPAGRVDDTTQIAYSQNRGNVQLALVPMDRDNLKAEVIQGQKEPMLGWLPGQNRAIPTVRFRKQQNAPARFATMLYPYKGEAPTIAFETIATSDPHVWAQRIHTALEDCDLALATDSASHPLDFSAQHLGAIQTHGSGLLIRHLKKNNDTFVSGWGLTSYQSAQCQLAFAAPGTFAWQLRADGALRIVSANTDVREVQIIKPFARSVQLHPGEWVDITASGITPLQDAPQLFEKRVAPPTGLSYGDYLKANPADGAGESVRIRIEAENLTLPAGVVAKNKLGASGQAIVGWDDVDSTLTAKLNIPQAGWYHITLRYCAAGSPIRSVLLNGKAPFADAGEIELSSTRGDFPSDGWSSSTDDWQSVTLGSAKVAGGWKFYLPKGPVELSFRNEGGGGANLDWIEIQSAQ